MEPGFGAPHQIQDRVGGAMESAQSPRRVFDAQRFRQIPGPHPRWKPGLNPASISQEPEVPRPLACPGGSFRHPPFARFKPRIQSPGRKGGVRRPARTSPGGNRRRRPTWRTLSACRVAIPGDMSRLPTPANRRSQATKPALHPAPSHVAPACRQQWRHGTQECVRHFAGEAAVTHWIYPRGRTVSRR